jgi:tetratricopeptide (TPR) repeat protein
LQKIIEGDKDKAQEAAIKSQAIQYFTEALKETDPNKQIELYNKVIELNSDFTEAYYNRGLAKYNLNKYQAAIETHEKGAFHTDLLLCTNELTPYFNVS